MFDLDQATTKIEATPGQVYSLFTSINQINLSLGDAPAASTFAYICAIQEKREGPLEVYIMLFQPKNNSSEFYRYEGGAVDSSVYAEIEAAAVEFTQNMGFMMDNMHFKKLDVEAKTELLKTLPPFTLDRSGFRSAPPVESSAPKNPEEFVDLGVEAEVLLSHDREPLQEAAPEPELKSEPDKPAASNNQPNLAALAKLLSAF